MPFQQQKMDLVPTATTRPQYEPQGEDVPSQPWPNRAGRQSLIYQRRWRDSISFLKLKHLLSRIDQAAIFMSAIGLSATR
jgi:hypothetical protein